MDPLVKGVLNNQISDAAKLVRMAEEGSPDVYRYLKQLYPYTGKAHIIGITGLPGAGKSTIINLLIKHYRNHGKSVGIIAIDPSSPISEGSIMGDRIRMMEHASDKDVFIKSLTTRGWLGGLSKTAARVANIMDAMGKDIVLLETVGVGQNEVSIMNFAHTIVLILVAEMGDYMQTIKAGVLEIGDIFVINKIDKRDPYDLKTNIESTIKNDEVNRDCWKKKIILTSALEKNGFHALFDSIEKHRNFFLAQKEAFLIARAKHEIKEEIYGTLMDWLNKKLHDDPDINRVLKDIAAKKEDPYAVSQQLLRKFNINQ